MDEKEQWRPVTLPEFKDIYQVSNLGQVKQQSTGRILQGTATQRGSLQVKLRLQRRLALARSGRRRRTQKTHHKHPDLEMHF